jgi:hypothetical protein
VAVTARARVGVTSTSGTTCVTVTTIEGQPRVTGTSSARAGVTGTWSTQPGVTVIASERASWRDGHFEHRHTSWREQAIRGPAREAHATWAAEEVHGGRRHDLTHACVT